MNRLNESMKQLIRNYSAGAVASVNADGSPAVSPKATFVIVDDNCITISRAELITSPAYDVGLKRDELVKSNFEKLSKLID